MHIDTQALPPKWQQPVFRFIERFRERYGMECAILYGSMATGDYHTRSDIDLIVISKGVPSDFWQRLKEISKFYESGVPIEPLAYTSEEFH